MVNLTQNLQDNYTVVMFKTPHKQTTQQQNVHNHNRFCKAATTKAMPYPRMLYSQKLLRYIKQVRSYIHTHKPKERVVIIFHIPIHHNGHVLLFKLLIRSLPATLYTFCTITFMASEPLKHTRSGSMVQNVAGRPEADSGPGPDLPAVWISPQTHQKYTVVYSELIRSLLATSYASLPIIGTSDVRGWYPNGYLLKYTKSTRAYTLS